MLIYVYLALSGLCFILVPIGVYIWYRVLLHKANKRKQ